MVDRHAGSPVRTDSPSSRDASSDDVGPKENEHQQRGSLK